MKRTIKFYKEIFERAKWISCTMKEMILSTIRISQSPDRLFSKDLTSQKTWHCFWTHACWTPSDPLAWCSAARRYMCLLYMPTFHIHVQQYIWNICVYAFGSTCRMQRGKEIHVSLYVFHIHVYISYPCTRGYGMATISRLLQIIVLFCRMSSLL